MYESPITKITADIVGNVVKREEDYLVESVHKVGFDINKEELEKALRYDRDQYKKGFNDGRLSASPQWIPVTERLPEPDSDMDILVTYIDGEEERIVPVNYGRGVWFDCIFDRELNPVKITAWMPLPKPWKGEV